MKQIPNPSRKRLVMLCKILSQIPNKTKITSVKISEISGWSEATIRRDISLLELHSGKSNGYVIEELRNSIQEKLNLFDVEKKKCCLVGLGKLGTALLENTDFSESNFKIVAGFDSSTNRIEILSLKIPLFSTSRMEGILRNDKIEFAILSVPDADAQKMCDKLISYGIKGIVNYTNTILKVPENISVENVNVLTALTNILSRNVEKI